MIVFACLLVSASATSSGYYYNSQQPYARYQQPIQPVAATAPLVKAAPAAAVALVAPVATGFSLETLMSLIPSAGLNLSKASASLDTLMKGLPAALANIDPAVKADFGKVNVIIAEVCNKMVSEATPQTYSYYNPEGIRVTCDLINKTANEIVLILNDPSITQSYTEKLQKLTASLQDQADVYSSIF